MAQELTARQWRDRVFEAFPVETYPSVFAGVVYYRAGKGGVLSCYHEASVFIRDAGSSASGAPPSCTGVTGIETKDPDRALELLRQRVANLQEQWGAWMAAHPEDESEGGVDLPF